MSLVSVYFLIFLAVCVLVYYLIPKKGQWGWLLFSSLAFYALCSFGMVLIPVLYAAVAFFFGKVFETKKKKGLMFLAIVLLIAILFVFKYARWLGSGWTGFLSGLNLGFAP